MLTPGVGFIYLVKLISGLPFGIFQSMFALVVVNTFRLTPAQHGMFMSYIGSLMIVRKFSSIYIAELHDNFCMRVFSTLMPCS